MHGRRACMQEGIRNAVSVTVVPNHDGCTSGAHCDVPVCGVLVHWAINGLDHGSSYHCSGLCMSFTSTLQKPTCRSMMCS